MENACSEMYAQVGVKVWLALQLDTSGQGPNAADAPFTVIPLSMQPRARGGAESSARHASGTYDDGTTGWRKSSLGDSGRRSRSRSVAYTAKAVLGQRATTWDTG